MNLYGMIFIGGLILFWLLLLFWPDGPLNDAGAPIAVKVLAVVGPGIVLGLAFLSFSSAL